MQLEVDYRPAIYAEHLGFRLIRTSPKGSMERFADPVIRHQIGSPKHF
jgi:hypothetical protein